MNLARTFTVFEKRSSLLHTWRHAAPRGGTACPSPRAFFPGCALPSFLPRTTRVAERVLAERLGIGSAFDCCGLPLEGLLGRDAFARRRGDAARRAHDHGIEGFVVACPNCAAAFDGSNGGSPAASNGGFLEVPVSTASVYRALAEAGIGERLGPGLVFVPCPDRASHRWLTDLEPFLGEGVRPFDPGICCGAAFAVEQPSAAARAARAVLRRAAEAAPGAPLYVYCASCAGALERARRKAARDGEAAAASVRVVHALSAILGIEEVPAVHTSVLNRVREALR